MLTRGCKRALVETDLLRGAIDLLLSFVCLFLLMRKFLGQANFIRKIILLFLWILLVESEDEYQPVLSGGLRASVTNSSRRCNPFLALGS